MIVKRTFARESDSYPYKAQHGQQSGDPAKLAQALLTAASQVPPPRRFTAGTDAIIMAEPKVADLQQQVVVGGFTAQ